MAAFNRDALRDLFAQFDEDDGPLDTSGVGIAGLSLDTSTTRAGFPSSDTRLGRGRDLIATGDVPGTFGRGNTFGRSSFPSLFVTTATDPDDYNTPVGQQSEGEDPFTMVGSNESTGITITSSATSSSVTTLHNIFIFPAHQQEMDSLCLKHIGTGVTVCVKANCTTNHRGSNGKRHKFPLGTIAVLKDRTTVFISPICNVQDISHEVLTNWQTGSRHTLSEWLSMFQNAENVKAALGVVTIDNLESEITFQNYASRFRSPRQGTDNVDSASKFSSFASLTDDLQAALKRKSIDIANAAAEEDEPGARKRILLLGTESVEDSMYILEVSIAAINSVMGALAKKMDDKTLLVADELRVVLNRTQGVENVIGEPIPAGNVALEAPTLWASIALLSSAIDEIQKVIDAFPHLFVEPNRQEMRRDLRALEVDLTKFIQEASRSLKDEVDRNTEKVESTQNSMSESMITLARNANTMKSEIRNLRATIMANDGHASNAADQATPPPAQATEVAALKAMVEELSTRMDSVVEDRASKAAKFFGITMRSNLDSNCWVAKNLSDESFGVIVDVHLVFEHIYNQAYSGEGVLKTLQGLYKVQIDTITQGLACSSFETRIPKFFKHHKAAEATTDKAVVRKPGVNKSALDRIASWEDWDETNSGMRALLESHLAEFKITHTMLMSDLLIPGTPAHNVAMLSASSSTSWITDLISYIDRTYREFHNDSGFTSERAWYVVTHLVHRIFTELSDPRVGVSSLLRLNSTTKTTQLTTWPIVQCHEIMKVFERAKFKDAPCISNEYVKFIMTNSSSDAKFASLQDQVKEALKNAKSASTAATTASNNANDANKLAKDLQKQVEKLEKNKNNK